MDTPFDEGLLVRYLLDTSTDEEKVRVEEQFFANDDTFGRLREIEDDLLTRYHRGQLPAEERAQLEEAYRQPPRRDRLLFHAALTRVTSVIPARSLVQGATEPGPLWAAGWRRWLTLEPV